MEEKYLEQKHFSFEVDSSPPAVVRKMKSLFNISKKHSTENKTNGRKHVRTRSLSKLCEKDTSGFSSNKVSHSKTIKNGKSVENLFICEKSFSSKTRTKYTSLTASTVDTLSGSDEEVDSHFDGNQRLRAIFEEDDEYKKFSIYGTPQLSKKVSDVTHESDEDEAKLRGNFVLLHSAKCVEILNSEIQTPPLL
jgi:hypothetical protein